MSLYQKVYTLGDGCVDGIDNARLSLFLFVQKKTSSFIRGGTHGDARCTPSLCLIFRFSALHKKHLARTHASLLVACLSLVFSSHLFCGHTHSFWSHQIIENRFTRWIQLSLAQPRRNLCTNGIGLCFVLSEAGALGVQKWQWIECKTIVKTMNTFSVTLFLFFIHGRVSVNHIDYTLHWFFFCLVAWPIFRSNLLQKLFSFRILSDFSFLRSLLCKRSRQSRLETTAAENRCLKVSLNQFL